MKVELVNAPRGEQTLQVGSWFLDIMGVIGVGTKLGDGHLTAVMFPSNGVVETFDPKVRCEMPSPSRVILEWADSSKANLWPQRCSCGDSLHPHKHDSDETHKAEFCEYTLEGWKCECSHE